MRPIFCDFKIFEKYIVKNYCYSIINEKFVFEVKII